MTTGAPERTSRARHMGFRGASGPARLTLGLVLVILILKLPAATIALLLPEGH